MDRETDSDSTIRSDEKKSVAAVRLGKGRPSDVSVTRRNVVSGNWRTVVANDHQSLVAWTITGVKNFYEAFHRDKGRSMTILVSILLVVVVPVPAKKRASLMAECSTV